MVSVCAYPKKLEDLSKGCHIKRKPPLGCGYVQARSYTILAIPKVLELVAPIIHRPCPCNEYVSVCNRVLGVTPTPTAEGLNMMRKASRLISKFLPQTTIGHLGALSAKYNGAKRKRYLAGENYVRSYGPPRRYISAFVKADKIDQNPPLGLWESEPKQFPDPRAIQFANPGYCVALYQYLGPIEHHLYNLTGDGRRLPATRLVGKGLNQVQRARELQRKLSTFRRPAVIPADMSRFDKHVSPKQLEIEHSVYLRCNSDPEFARLLNQQLHNRCSTRNGLKYVVFGKRMSGDMNTALGNCIIMLCMCIAFFHSLRVKFDLFCDGDDCLLIVELGDVHNVVSKAPSVFRSFGHVIKLEKISTTLPPISWCQSCPIQFRPGLWKFVRNPRKVMSGDLIGSKWNTTDVATRQRLLSSVGLCELILNLGVPVLQEYALALLRASSGVLPFSKGDFYQSSLAIRLKRELKTMPKFMRGSLSDFNLHHLMKIRPQPITSEARLSFSEAFHIDISDQLFIEKRLSHWTIIVSGSEFCPFNKNSSSWDDGRVTHGESYH